MVPHQPSVSRQHEQQMEEQRQKAQRRKESRVSMSNTPPTKAPGMMRSSKYFLLVGKFLVESERVS